MNCLWTLFALLAYCHVLAQSSEDILLTVEDVDVTVGEFKYIYEKNSHDQVDYSEASLREYLHLYKRFKMKVQLAHDLQLDTISSLKAELAGYRAQLTESYLNDRKITEELARELYERMKYDIDASHILIPVAADATESSARAALERAGTIRERIIAGEAFEDLVASESSDESTRSTQGRLGFITAMLPNGFYDFETAIYNLQAGEVSRPVRSPLGYHVLRINDRRSARGQVEIAHILVRVSPGGRTEEEAYDHAIQLVEQIGSGDSFENLAVYQSEDNNTAKRRGYIGKVGIGTYDPQFEEAVFAIQEPGDISQPIRSRLGWHIVKLLDKAPLRSYSEEEAQLKARIAGNERIALARDGMLAEIKAHSGYKVDQAVLAEFAALLDPSFLTFKWDVPQMEERVLVSFSDGTSFSNLAFAEYAKDQTRERMGNLKRATPTEVAEELFDGFAGDCLLAYEEKYLAAKYPEFAAILREYEEGIMLFEVTKREVWDKASTDTAGLKAYFAANRHAYQWPERIELVEYSLNSQNSGLRTKAYTAVEEYQKEDWVAYLQADQGVATFKVSKLNQGQLESRMFKWEPGWTSGILSSSSDAMQFVQVGDVIPSAPKELDESRGYVIADYQTFLEQEWVQTLEKEYNFKINEAVLSQLIDGVK